MTTHNFITNIISISKWWKLSHHLSNSATQIPNGMNWKTVDSQNCAVFTLILHHKTLIWYFPSKGHQWNQFYLDGRVTVNNDCHLRMHFWNASGTVIKIKCYNRPLITSAHTYTHISSHSTVYTAEMYGDTIQHSRVQNGIQWRINNTIMARSWNTQSINESCTVKVQAFSTNLYSIHQWTSSNTSETPKMKQARQSVQCGKLICVCFPMSKFTSTAVGMLWFGDSDNGDLGLPLTKISLMIQKQIKSVTTCG